jgi:hypothetical protein
MCIGAYRMSEDDDEGIVDLRVKEVMAREPVTVESERTVKETGHNRGTQDQANLAHARA